MDAQGFFHPYRGYRHGLEFLIPREVFLVGFPGDPNFHPAVESSSRFWTTSASPFPYHIVLRGKTKIYYSINNHRLHLPDDEPTIEFSVPELPVYTLHHLRIPTVRDLPPHLAGTAPTASRLLHEGGDVLVPNFYFAPEHASRVIPLTPLAQVHNINLCFSCYDKHYHSTIPHDSFNINNYSNNYVVVECPQPMSYLYQKAREMLEAMERQEDNLRSYLHAIRLLVVSQDSTFTVIENVVGSLRRSLIPWIKSRQILLREVQTLFGALPIFFDEYYRNQQSVRAARITQAARRSPMGLLKPTKMVAIGSTPHIPVPSSLANSQVPLSPPRTPIDPYIDLGQHAHHIPEEIWPYGDSSYDFSKQLTKCWTCGLPYPNGLLVLDMFLPFYRRPSLTSLNQSVNPPDYLEDIPYQRQRTATLLKSLVQFGFNQSIVFRSWIDSVFRRPSTHRDVTSVDVLNINGLVEKKYNDVGNSRMEVLVDLEDALYDLRDLLKERSLYEGERD